jgi:hypothetical protein
MRATPRSTPVGNRRMSGSAETAWWHDRRHIDVVVVEGTGTRSVALVGRSLGASEILRRGVAFVTINLKLHSSLPY